MASAARTVYIGPVALPSTAQLRWPDRTTADVLDCTADFTKFLADAGGDTIASFSVAAVPSDLILTLKSSASGVLTWIVSAGSLTNPVTDYSITINITTAAGLQLQRTIWCRTLPLSPNNAYETALQQVIGPPGPAGVTSVTATATTLAAGSAATASASLSGQALALQIGVPQGASPSSATAITAYVPGNQGYDAGGASSTHALYDLAAHAGSMVDLTWFENNAGVTPSMAGKYLTQARSAANGVAGWQAAYVDNILDAAIAYAVLNNVALYVPAGQYVLTTSHNSLPSNLTMIGAPGGQTVFLKKFALSGNSAAFGNANGSTNNITLQDIVVANYGSVYCHLLTGVVLPSPDLWDENTVSIGDATGLTLVSWQTSASQLAASSTNTLYFDALPAGYTLAQLQAAIVGGQANYVNGVTWGSTVASIQTATNGAWNGYSVTLTPPSGYAVPYPSPFVAPNAGSLPKVQTLAVSDTNGAPAWVAPTIVFSSAATTLYKGNHFFFFGDDHKLTRVWSIGVANGRAFFGYGNRGRLDSVAVLATRGYAGDAGIRWDGPLSVYLNCKINSGDQCVQHVINQVYDPYYLVTVNNPVYASSQNGFSCTHQGGRYVNIGGGPAGTMIMSAGAGGTPASVVTTALYSSPNTVTLPTAALTAAGITLAALQDSAPPWVNAFNYNQFAAGYRVVANGNVYQLVSGSGLSKSTGSGPAGTGSSIADGGYVWAFVSGSASTIYIYDNALSWIAPGAYVTNAATVSSNTVITIMAPNGLGGNLAQPVTETIIPSGTTIIFLTGAAASPPMVMNCVAESYFSQCYFKCIGGGVQFAANNQDSLGALRVRLRDCVLDGSQSLATASYTGSALQVLGPPVSQGGGVQFYGSGLRFYMPRLGAIQANGYVTKFILENSEIGQVQDPAYATLAPLSLAGIVQGIVRGNTIWSPVSTGGGYVAGVVTLGTAPATSNGLAQSNVTQDIIVEGNDFRGLCLATSTSIPALNVDYCTAATIQKNTFFNTGVPPAVGVAITANAGAVFTGGNDFSRCDVAYSGTLTNLQIVAPELYYTTSSNYVAPPGYAVLIPSAGTFTVNMTFATPGDLSVNVTTAHGTYYKIGKQVFVQFTLTATPTFTTASGVISITGLPFAAASNSSMNMAIPPTNTTGAFPFHNSATSFVFAPQAGTTAMGIVCFRNGFATSQILASDLTSGTAYTWSGAGTYLAAS